MEANDIKKDSRNMNQDAMYDEHNQDPTLDNINETVGSEYDEIQEE